VFELPRKSLNVPGSALKQPPPDTAARRLLAGPVSSVSQVSIFIGLICSRIPILASSAATTWAMLSEVASLVVGSSAVNPCG
jgi:hypothetical protein